MANESVAIDPETGKEIPMKDGKPCRTCVDFKTWSKLGKTKTQPEASRPSTSAVKNEESSEEWKRKNCPADVETLGRHTWTLLHTMAAYYPERPSPSQQDSMRNFFQSFSENYPCWFCKNDFQKDIIEEPINVKNRDTLSEWLCKRHNKVNEKLGKKQFDCTKVFERWLNGPPNGQCDQ
ncbi:FAD-linked sulfhydryl oxidase ALR-like protein [Sporodiniella umbellata]|nr:FAD-linked sulfhydryl oxidase ALR-like protein [Sporodiniella umbellata]